MDAKELLVTETPDREPTHPGTILREDVLPTLRLSVSAATRQLGVTRQTLHRIIAGTHAITPEMALPLGGFAAETGRTQLLCSSGSATKKLDESCYRREGNG